jgi:hypothetical protein
VDEELLGFDPGGEGGDELDALGSWPTAAAIGAVSIVASSSALQGPVETKVSSTPAAIVA